MDNKEQVLTFDTSIPAHIVCGPDTATTDFVRTICASLIGRCGNCRTCTSCQKIMHEHHEQILWLTTEKGYTIDDVEPLFHATSFMRDQSTPLCIVITQAHLLNTTCANSLLKLIEEPPPGYYFFFATPHAQLLLPTIRSRCALTIIAGEQNTAAPHDIMSHFMPTAPYNPLAFSTAVDQLTLNEHEVTQLIDSLLTLYRDTMAQRIKTSKTDSFNTTIDILLKSRAKPPMPGSGKLFLRYLYMACMESKLSLIT